MANEQVGNDSYTTLTPGSAVAGQLQQILASKRLEARQAMMDEITRRNVESEIQTRADTVETNRASREATEEWRKAQAAKSIQDEQDRYLSRFKSGQQLQNPATIAKIRGIDPDLLQQTGGATLPSTQIGGGATLTGAPPSLPIAPSITQSPSVPDTSIPTQTTYTGTGDQQSDLQHELAMRAMAQDPNTPPALKQWLAMSVGARKGGIMPPASLFPQPTEDVEVPLIGWGRDGQPYDTGMTTKKGAIVRPEPAPQQPNMSSMPQLYQLTVPDPTDPTKTNIESHMFTPNEMKAYLEAHPELQVRKGNVLPVKPTAAGEPPKVTDSTWKEWLNVNAAYDTSPSSVQAEEALSRQAHKVINESSNSANVKAWLGEAWDAKGSDGTSHPARTMDANSLMVRMQNPSVSLTKPEKAEVRSIWDTLKKNQ